MKKLSENNKNKLRDSEDEFILEKEEIEKKYEITLRKLNDFEMKNEVKNKIKTNNLKEIDTLKLKNIELEEKIKRQDSYMKNRLLKDKTNSYGNNDNSNSNNANNSEKSNFNEKNNNKTTNKYDNTTKKFDTNTDINNTVFDTNNLLCTPTPSERSIRHTATTISTSNTKILNSETKNLSSDINCNIQIPIEKIQIIR